MLLRTVEDACPYNGGRVAEDVDPYKIILNIFMRSSLLMALFLLIHFFVFAPRTRTVKVFAHLGQRTVCLPFWRGKRSVA